MKIKGLIEDLKLKKIKNLKMVTVKIYLGISLELLWIVWGQFIFRQFLDLAYTFQDLQAPSNVSVLTTGFYLLHLSLPKQFPLFISASSCLLVSSVSNFRPDSRGRWWSLIQAPSFSPAVGRGEHCKQTLLACAGSARSVSAALGLPPLGACVRSPSTLLRLQGTPWGTV